MWIVLYYACIASFLGGSFGLVWSDSSNKNSTYACAGENLTLDWNITSSLSSKSQNLLRNQSLDGSIENDQSENSLHDVITQIEWYYKTSGQFSQPQLIAVLSHDNFLPTPELRRKRLQHVGLGGLYFPQVNQSDSGLYTIKVVGRNSSGHFFTEMKSRHVLIGETLLTTDGLLHANKLTEAKWDDSDKQFHIELTCGTFLYLSQPPFQVEWKLPNGNVVQSSGYHDGHLRLQLENPTEGGNYTCRIPKRYFPLACLENDSSATQNVHDVVHVNSLESRITILDAEQKLNIAENKRLRELLANRTVELQEIKDNESQDNGFIGSSNTSSVSFHGLMTQSSLFTSSHVTICGPYDVRNNVSYFNAYSGYFTAPFNASYFLAASASFYLNDRLYSNNRNIGADLISNNQLCCKVRAVGPRSGSISLSRSCQCIMNLEKGDRVWLQTYSENPNHYFVGQGFTSMSGFMLDDFEE